jgi:hypothetical protein
VTVRKKKEKKKRGPAQEDVRGSGPHSGNRRRNYNPKEIIKSSI